MLNPVLVSALLASAQAAGGPSDPMYLGTYFLDNGQAGVYLAASADGLRFEPLLSPNVPIITPKIGTEKLTRDACLLRDPRGQWHMTWTTGWWEKGFGLAHSKDLVTWSEQEYLEPMQGTLGTLNCWAPEIAFDPATSRYILFWASTVLGAFPETENGGDPGPDGQKCNHRFYFTTTPDFKAFTPARLYYNPGFNCIDATLLPPEKAGQAWHMFFKDETRFPPSKNIRHLAVPDPAAPSGQPSPPITGAYWAEGPSSIRINGKVRVYFDRYADNRFGAVESTDLEHWTDISDSVSFPKDARHSTVVRVDREFVDSVRAGLRARPAAPAAAEEPKDPHE